MYSHFKNGNASDNSAIVVDLRSDTITKPNARMRKAMAEAEVGDDVFQEDPTVNALQDRVAELFGKEAAIFVATGTQGNLSSVISHCQTRGSEIILGNQSHIHIYEQAGIAQFGGIHPRSVKTHPDGTFDLDELEGAIRKVRDIHFPNSALICIENPWNGAVLPLEYLAKVRKIADKYKLPVHMDGARFMNAVTALDVEPKDILQYVDSVSMCFSKGLGAPVGAIVAGTQDFVSLVRRTRKALGGGMRQSGILAAAASVALDEAHETMTKDHRHAKMIAETINSCGQGIAEVDVENTTINIVFIKFLRNDISGYQFADRLKKTPLKEEKALGEKISVVMIPASDTKVRAVTHCNIDEDKIEKCLKKLKYVLQEFAGQKKRKHNEI